MWPRGAIQFLQELEANNDSAWFKANRKRYDEDLLAPARALADSLGHLGEPHFFRPYRDTRFRPGPPLKEHFAFGIGYGSVGGYYVDLSLDGLLIGAGLHHPERDQLERFRAAINDGRRAKGFEHAAATAAEARLKLNEPALKRPPRGYPADHPRLDLLRVKNLTVFHRHKLGRWLHTAECDKRIRTQLDAARPLVKWLRDNVGPSTRQRPG